MRTTVVALFCVLVSAAGFVPVTPVRNARSAVGKTSRTTSSSSTSLSMGFDFKSTLEKMSDTRYARVRHILVEEKGEEGRAKLEEAKAKIGGDLDKFSEVAEKISTCTSAPKGGRLKLLARGETVPEFDDIAFNAELGKVHGPVETAFGTHLIYVETCNKPENTWKKLFDDIVEKVSGKEEEKE
ncbi:unnamed protein product [Hapterophycus canaliculatus]